ncbi:hypothetical protein KKG31_04650 [Patescibacteria group bacterium]|nr:hypothetical protein [Patescibacteria group bacterium]
MTEYCNNMQFWGEAYGLLKKPEAVTKEIERHSAEKLIYLLFSGQMDINMIDTHTKQKIISLFQSPALQEEISTNTDLVNHTPRTTLIMERIKFMLEEELENPSNIEREDTSTS